MAEEKTHAHSKQVKVGSVVLYYKETEDNKGIKKLVPFPLHVADTAPPGSFQAKDQAIGGWLLQTPRKGGLEYRDGILYSEKPSHGRWSHQ